MNIEKQLNITVGTVNSLTDLKDGSNMNQLITYFEKEFPDSSYYFDVNLSALIETLNYNGFTDNDILKYNTAFYGTFIEFIYFKDLEMYVMEFGTR